MILRVALVFLLVAIVMGVWGFTGIGGAGEAALARFVFVLCSGVFVSGLIAELLARRGIL